MKIKEVKLIDFSDDAKRIIDNILSKKDKISDFANLNSKADLEKYLYRKASLRN